MSQLVLLLLLAPPIVTIAYAVAEHYGWLDAITGRRAALDALARLQSATGYPDGWLYDDQRDWREFRGLMWRIVRRSTSPSIRAIAARAASPSCIAVGGDPVQITGVPAEWDLAQRRCYLPGHSVMFLYGVTRENAQPGKADRACTLAEVEKWLTEEKDARRFYLGAVVVSLITIGLLFLRCGAGTG